jgi:hypothetical protein
LKALGQRGLFHNNWKFVGNIMDKAIAIFGMIIILSLIVVMVRAM